MQFGPCRFEWLLLLALVGGCDGDGNGNHADNRELRWEEVEPPRSIDIESCFAIVDDGKPTTVSNCSDCCAEQGMAVSSFSFDTHCTCADPTKPNTEICATRAAAANDCNACCQAAKYTWSDWLDADNPSCTCDMLLDSDVCRSALTRSEPAEQCAMCCLHHGFFGNFFSGLGVAECSCSAP